MKLKNLQIQHKQYYSPAPTEDKYTGKVEFFNEKGEALTIILRDEQLAGIVELCSAGIVSAAKEAAQSIVAAFNPVLQIESVNQDAASKGSGLDKEENCQEK